MERGSELQKEVAERIIERFSDDVKKHLFSEKDYPEEVTVKTIYKNGTQYITIKFYEE